MVIPLLANQDLTPMLTEANLVASCLQGRRENPSLEGGGRLNLPEFTWLISCSIVTDHYLFQCLTAMFFGYLQKVTAGE